MAATRQVDAFGAFGIRRRQDAIRTGHWPHGRLEKLHASQRLRMLVAKVFQKPGVRRWARLAIDMRR